MRDWLFHHLMFRTFKLGRVSIETTQETHRYPWQIAIIYGTRPNRVVLDLSFPTAYLWKD